MHSASISQKLGEQKAVKEQLEVHIQTIGILVSEKSDLQTTNSILMKPQQSEPPDSSNIRGFFKALTEEAESQPQSFFDISDLVRKPSLEDGATCGSRRMADISDEDQVLASGEFAFVKSGQRPFWPARLLSVNQINGKWHVFLYELHLTVDVKKENVVKMSDDSRERYGKDRRKGSQNRDVFASAMF